MEKYTKTYNVILDNMDLNHYRIRPIAVIMYLQDAFARYTATKKMAAYDLFAKNLYWVVAEFNMEFVGDLPFWSEEIKVELWFSEISKLKIYFDFNIYYKDKVFTKGNALWFLIDKNSKRPARTDIMTDKFNIRDELVLGEHKKFGIPEKKEIYKTISHTTNLSDIDFNSHVNNKSYINLAEMTEPDDFKKNYTLKELHIRFNKETFLGDVLECTAYKTELANKYVHVIEKNNESVCDIVTTWLPNEKQSQSIVEYNLDIKNEN